MGKFTITNRFRNTIHLINTLESSKIHLFLTKILESLISKEESKIFSQDELEQLQEVLGLETMADVTNVIDGCTYIFEFAACHSMNVQELHTELTEIGLENEKLIVFKTVWKTHCDAYIESIKSQTFSPKSLVSTHWEMKLHMAQAGLSRISNPSALLQMNINDKVSNDIEKVTVEFTLDELKDFYLKLESIQNQLDNLN